TVTFSVWASAAMLIVVQAVSLTADWIVGEAVEGTWQPLAARATAAPRTAGAHAGAPMPTASHVRRLRKEGGVVVVLSCGTIYQSCPWCQAFFADSGCQCGHPSALSPPSILIMSASTLGSTGGRAGLWPFALTVTETPTRGEGKT